MAWYRTGTITVTNGSTTVTGSGTAWISNAAIGEALYAPDGRLYEIVNIASDTTLTLQSAYLGATASAQTYVIVPSQSYIRDLAAQAADLVNNYSTIANNAGVGKFGDGTLANPGIRFSDDLDTGFYRSASNEVTFVAGGTAIFKYNLTGGLSLTSGGDLVGTTATQTLTNKTLTAPVLGGTVTGTYTLGGTPTFPSSVVLTTGAQTLASKTLTNPVINGFTGDTSIINIGSGQVYKDASGNVGIGTASPNQRLTVIGNLRAIGASNTVSLELAGASSATDGAYSIKTQATRSLTFTDDYQGLERMRIDSSGNLGLGVTPSAWTATNIKALQVKTASVSSNGGSGYFSSNVNRTSGGNLYIDSSYAGAIEVNNAGAGGMQFMIAPSGTAGNAISFTQAMTLAANGNLSIGNTFAQGRLAISGSGGNTGSGDLVLDSNASYSEIQSYSSKPLLLNRQGNAVIVGGSTSSSYQFNVSMAGGSDRDIMLIGVSGLSNGFTVRYASSAMQYTMNGLGTGTVSSSSGVLSASSDQNMKIADGVVTSAIDKVMALQPRYFFWKDKDGNANEDQGRQLGFFAQEVNAVIPEASPPPKTDQDGWGIYDRAVVATLTAALQELKQEFDAYKAAHP